MRPDVVVVETGLEGMAGSDLVRRLLATVPDAAVVCWTEDATPVAVAEMLGAGAVAYVSKEDGPEAILRTMRPVRAGSIALSTPVAAQLAGQLVGESEQTTDLESALENVGEELDSVTTAKARLHPERLARAPDAGHDREGDRVRAPEPGPGR